MAKKSKIAKWRKQRKLLQEGRMQHPVKFRNRCYQCGRPRAYMRKFGMCRICFRAAALQGLLPGVTKSSW